MSNIIWQEDTLETLIEFYNLRGVFLLFLSLIVIGLFLFSVYMLFVGGNRMKVKLHDQTSRDFLREKTPTLLPWHTEQALSDISSLCVHTGVFSRLGGRWSHGRGTIQSLKNWRDAWLAYAINTHEHGGSVVMHTSTNRIDIKVEGENPPQRLKKAKITVDNRVLGSMNIETRELFDELGQPLGRVKGGSAIIIRGMSNYVTVEIRGKEIAQINTEPYRLLERIGPMPPAFRIYETRLSTDNKWWLIALYAIALYRDFLISHY